MPDNEINIKINLNTTESGTSLQRLHQQLNAIIADTERAQRQQGWAGLRGIETDTANIRAQIAALQEAKTETQRTRNTNLEYALGPEPTREIITTRRLPAVASSLSMAAAGDEDQREQRHQALIQQTTLVHDREQKKRTDAANREADQRANAAQREADKQEQQARRAAAASSKARMADYNSWLDQQQKLEKATTTQVREAERILNRGIFTAQPNEFPVTPTTLGRLNDATQWRNFFQRRQTEETIHAANQRGGFSGWTAGINRIGSLEGQAAVINTVQALASGMSPMHVAMMEIPQVAGAAIQGGLLSFKQILTFIGSAAGVAGIALGGVAAVLGQIISTGAQARTAMLSTQGSLTAQGFGGEGVISQKSLIEERNQLKSQFRNVIGSSDINTIFGQFNTAAPEAQQYRSRLASASIALAGTQNIEIEEAAKVLGKAAEGGAQGLIEFTKKLNIGDDLSRQRLSITAISDPSKAFNQALTLIEQRTEAGRAATATEGNFLIPALPKIIASVKTDIDQGTIYNSLRYLFTGFAPIDQTKSTPREPQAMQVGLNLAAAGTPEMKERVELQEKYTKLLQTQRELLQSIENLPQGGPEIDTQMERLSRVNESIRNVERGDRPKGVAETKQDAADIARFQHSLELAQNAANNDISQASRVVSARAALNAEITRQHASAVELQKGKARELSAAEIQAAQETEQARRGLAQRSIDIMLQLSNLERARIGPANISAQREIVQRDVATVTANKDVDESLKISQRTEEVNILRNERLEVENVNIAQIRQGELILQAKEDLAGIVTLRRQEAAIIEGSKDRTPADVIQARSNVIQSQIQASTQARRLELESVNSIGQAEERRFQTVSSLLNLQVARGTANTWQTLPLEQQITSQGTDTQAARLQALLNTGNLERSERIRVNEQLAALYEADAQKQIELQTRVTESIKAENARRVENFKNFFSSVETASSDLLIAGLLKSQTREQAVRSFATSVVTSFVRETENMASKFAGKGLAKLLDVKLGEGEDSSISNVLAKKAGSVLGITLDEPKLNQAAIADRMKAAGDAQKQAGDLMLQAAREMSAKAQEAPYRGGKETEFSTNVVRETEKRASTVDTSSTTQRTIPSSTGAYGVPGAVMNYGRSGALGTQEEAAANLTKISAQSGATFQVHKEAAPAFQGLISDLESRGYKINPEESGGYAKREMRGGTGFSEHAFGTAIDINPSKNPWMTHQTDFPPDISEMAAKRGLVWGGNWPNKPDPMHFQWGGPNAGIASAKADTRETTYNVPLAQKTISLDEPTPIAPLQLSQPAVKSNYFLSNAVPTLKVDQAVHTQPVVERNSLVQNPTITADSIAQNPTVTSESLDNNRRDQVVKVDATAVSQGVQPGSDRGSASASVAARSDTQEPVQAPQYYVPSILSNPAAPTSTYFMNNALDMKEGQSTTNYQDVANANANSQQQWISELKSTQLKIDPASVAQGIQQGQQQVVSEFRSSIQEGTVQGQAATVSATNRDVQQTETNARDVESNSTKTETNTQSIDKLTNQLQTQTSQQGQQINTSSTGSITTTGGLDQQSTQSQVYNQNYQIGLQSGLQGKTSATSTFGDTVQVNNANGGDAAASGGGLSMKSGLSTLSSGLGLASSAALLFGNHLSTSGRMVLGGVSLLSNGLSFLTSVTSLLQGANILNTAATTVNTVATTANSAAQVGGAGGGAAAIALPLAMAALEGGGVISAERGIVIPSITSAAGGNIISSITSAAAGTVVRPIISAEVGTILQPIPSAAGGMFVKENSLSSSIRSGIQSMARGGQTGAFAAGRMVSGPRVNDGKGGQLIIAHDGEMIVPRAETAMILNAINNPVVHSAEAGMILDNRGSAAISMSPPHMAASRSNIDNTIREAITNIASTSSTSTNNNTTLNYTAHTTGYHPYKTRSDMEGMLRQHGSTLMRWAESNFKNGSWPQRSF